MSIECAFFGFLSADAEQRKSQAGKPWVRLNVGVGQAETLQWVSVAVFGKAAEKAAELKKGDRCYIEGRIKLDTWRGNDGVERHGGLSVAAFRCEQTHQIGRNRPKRERKPPADGRYKFSAPRSAASLAARTDQDLNDEIPF